MTLQQLKYIITIAETGSITMAAERLFIAQPSLSKAVAELEKEMGISIFNRSNRGVYLSEEGTKFLSYARQVVEQSEMLESEYKSAPPPNRAFAVSSQHYAFVVNAFVELVREYGGDKYEFSLRELKTAEIIEDVRTHRSDIGVLYLSKFNREVVRHILKSEELKFESLFTAKPHVFGKGKGSEQSRNCRSLHSFSRHLGSVPGNTCRRRRRNTADRHSETSS